MFKKAVVLEGIVEEIRIVGDILDRTEHQEGELELVTWGEWVAWVA